jgi:hypothetical protein
VGTPQPLSHLSTLTDAAALQKVRCLHRDAHALTLHHLTFRPQHDAQHNTVLQAHAGGADVRQPG